MVLTLYKMDMSPPARAAMIIVEELGLKANQIEVNVIAKEQLKPEFIKINPQHTVPTLVDDDFIVWESHAILTYLVTKYAEDDSLYPKDPKVRATIDQRMYFDSSILFAQIRTVAGQIINDKPVTNEIIDVMDGSYAFLEAFLEGHKYLAADHFTVADISCGATVSSMKLLKPIDERKFPKLVSWLQKVMEEPSFKKANDPGLEKFAELMTGKIPPFHQ